MWYWRRRAVIASRPDLKGVSPFDETNTTSGQFNSTSSTIAATNSLPTSKKGRRGYTNRSPWQSYDSSGSRTESAIRSNNMVLDPIHSTRHPSPVTLRRQRTERSATSHHTSRSSHHERQSSFPSTILDTVISDATLPPPSYSPPPTSLSMPPSQILPPVKAYYNGTAISSDLGPGTSLSRLRIPEHGGRPLPEPPQQSQQLSPADIENIARRVADIIRSTDSHSPRSRSGTLSTTASDPQVGHAVRTFLSKESHGPPSTHEQ